MNESSWPFWLDQKARDGRPVHVHLVGIGGSGLSAIACVLLERGFVVSGSDRQEGAALAHLRRLGAAVFIGHDAAHAAGADLVLISSAVMPDNPEVRAAQAAGAPVVKRAPFLEALLRRQRVIAAAGTHGKTTTTGMIASALQGEGLQPGFIVGGLVRTLGVNAAAGAGDLFVIEADEYDRMFWGLHPAAAIVTNVEWDHPDCYATAKAFEAAFEHFVGQIQSDGWLIACGDDPGAQRLAEGQAAAGRRVLRYGLAPDCDLYATEIELTESGGSTAQVWCGPYSHSENIALFWPEGTGEGPGYLGRLRLQVPGAHNVRNALAALAAAQAVGVTPAAALAQLALYRGAGRRFEAVGEAHGVRVYDDYAHHPTEVRATLAAARRLAGRGRIWVFFQPHTFSRTRALWDDFCHAFGDADQVLVGEIYAARETDSLGVSGAALAAALEHPAARFTPTMQAAAEALAQETHPGDLVLTLGAGDGNRVGPLFLRIVNARSASPTAGGTPFGPHTKLAFSMD